MERESSPYVFNSVTDLSVTNVEKVDARFDCITRLTLEFESKLPPGTHSLILVGPFPPFGRPGTRLETLKTLQKKSIESISAFPGCTDERSPEEARVEIVAIDDEGITLRCREFSVLFNCADLRR